jgi:RNA polymerase-binding transcription factor DksA
MILTSRFAPPALAKLRRDLMARGLTLATLLADALAGKQPPELAALLAQRPGKRPEEVLRLALDQVERRRELLDTDDDRFGRCTVCGTDLGLTALGEMPWADRCAAHGATG